MQVIHLNLTADRFKRGSACVVYGYDLCVIFIFAVLELWLTQLQIDCMQFLWPPYGIGQAIIFSSCGFFYLLSSSFFFLLPSSFFFPRLISAVADWMSTIIPHTLWP